MKNLLKKEFNILYNKIILINNNDHLQNKLINYIYLFFFKIINKL